MSKLQELKNAKTIFELARILGYQPHTFTYLLYSNSPSLGYKKFNIPKKTGGTREISKPCDKIMALQKKLSTLLLECEAEINEGKNNMPAHGFVKGRSIYTNAAAHRNKRFVINFDLENFFGSINFGRVRGFFISNKNYALHKDVATAIAKIACHENKLPQGSPASPVISNMIGNIVDVRISALASKNKLSYTRYADDITLSTNQKSPPADIIYETESNQWHIGEKIESIITRSGFQVNHKKTRLQYFESRREVTGLSVGIAVNTKIEYRRKARAMVDNLIKNDIYHFNGNQLDAHNLKKLKGILGFIFSIDNQEKIRKNGGEKQKFEINKLTSREKTFKKFISYEFFAGNKVPTILCEGKTDYVYLKCALEMLPTEITKTLYAREENKPPELRFKTFKANKTTESLFGLNGGEGDLRNIIINYEKSTSAFDSKHFTHPVIIILDDDKGSASIKSTIKTKSPDLLEYMEKNWFCNYAKNLYILLIPKKGCAIEDLFDDDTLSEKLNGKKFNKANNGGSTASEYGKNHFAEYVVKKKKSEINFNGFIPLICKLNEIIALHAEKTEY